MEMERGPSSGVKILERLRKGEISDEELKKHIRLHWEKRLQWGYKPTFQEQLQSNLNFIKSLTEMEMSADGVALTEMEMSAEVEMPLNNDESDEVSNHQKKKKSYELSSEYLRAMFGKTLKQSACYFKDESMTLDEAEEAAYELYCERAQIKDGQTVIDIGCGHGGLVLYIAQKYKNCHVTGLTNSTTHVNYIDMQCKKLQLSNVDAILADVTKYETEKTWDRIVVIGTVEHMKNIGLFMKKLSTWMNKESLLFVDHTCHTSFNYHFEAMDEDDWYSGYIFPKGRVTFLSSSTLLYFQEDVSVVDHWVFSGMHMARSMQEWMKKLEQNMEIVRRILEQTMEGGSKDAVNQVLTHLRTFLIGGYETFSSNNGEELMMAQFLFKKKQ